MVQPLDIGILPGATSARSVDPNAHRPHSSSENPPIAASFVALEHGSVTSA
jgi:hypothetical protein